MIIVPGHLPCSWMNWMPLSNSSQPRRTPALDIQEHVLRACDACSCRVRDIMSTTPLPTSRSWFESMRSGALLAAVGHRCRALTRHLPLVSPEIGASDSVAATFSGVESPKIFSRANRENSWSKRSNGERKVGPVRVLFYCPFSIGSTTSQAKCRPDGVSATEEWAVLGQ